MDLIDRYLNAVAAQLPQDERADIIAELRDLILSRFEAREEELGRALTDDEKEAILHEIGHPLVVAARYRKGPDGWRFVYRRLTRIHVRTSPGAVLGQLNTQTRES